MKVTLDISRLVEDGNLTHEEADRLKKLAAHDTGQLGINIVIGFAVVAIALSAIALMPKPVTAITLGLGLLPTGCAILLARVQRLIVPGQICLMIGALTFAGGVVAQGEGSLTSMVTVTAAFAIAAVAARSSLLAALSVLTASACLGADTGYVHASYFLGIPEPTLTVVLFSVLALIAWQGSKLLSSAYERLAITVARTSLLLVNFGFWIGSLWGDRLSLLRGIDRSTWSGPPPVPSELFVVLWAIVLVGAGVWAARVNRRWVVNLVAIFGGIHFYTQWFERLGATPGSMLTGGLLLLGVGAALAMLRTRSRA